MNTSFTKEEKISKILSKSVFSLIPQNKVHEVVQASFEYEFTENMKLNERISPNSLYLVLEGSVDQIDPETGMLVENTIEGRSIEFDALFRKDGKWKNDWLSRTSGSLLGIPFELLERVLKGSIVFDYLEKIVTHIEFHRIKNDLRLLGLEQDKIQRLIAKLSATGKEIEFKNGDLLVLKGGVVQVSYAIESKVYDLKRFSISDYFIFKKEECFSYRFSDDVEIWSIHSQSLSAILPQKLIASLDVIDQRRFEISTLTPNGDRDENQYEVDHPEEIDDGLKLEDFYSSVELPDGIQKLKPVSFMQYDQMDCGAACMAMISHYYGKKINIPTWRSLIHVTREGASMLAIKLSATQMGFDVIGVMSGLKALAEFRTPFIALMEYHYVVVYKITDQMVLIADPAQGFVEQSLVDFKASYSSNCLLLKPNLKFLSAPESLPAYQKYYFLFKEVLSNLLLIFIFSVILFIVSLSVPLFIQFLFDNVLKSGDIKYLNRVGVFVSGLVVFLSVATYLRAVMLTRITNTLGVKLSSLFFRHTLKLPFNYFAMRNVGDITTRVEELTRIRDFLSHQMTDILINLLAIILYSSVFYIYSPKLFVLAVAFMFGLFFIMNPLFNGFIKLNQKLFYAMGKSHSIAFEQFRSLRTIQTLAAELQARWRWEESYDSILKMRDHLNAYRLKLMSIHGLAEQVISLSFLLLSVHLFMRGELTLGQVVAVSVLSSSLIAPILALVQVSEQITQIKVSFEKIDEIVTSPAENLAHVNLEKKLNEGVNFRKVWFQYGSDLSPWILKDVDLDVKPGEKVALVGSSGSGKSTLAYMINLVYHPTRGIVNLGETPNTKISLSELRQRVSMILQDHTVFTGTILQNIAFGEEYPDFERAVRAAKIAEAHEFISQLSLGYSTAIGDGLKDLSGGQKQRLSIARAIYRQPEILILDEATSALDSMTEKKVLKNLKKELKNTTCFTIAHRFNTIMDSDKIVVLDKGRIIEQGNHDELMKRQGAYYELFRKQVTVG